MNKSYIDNINNINNNFHILFSDKELFSDTELFSDVFQTIDNPKREDNIKLLYTNLLLLYKKNNIDLVNIPKIEYVIHLLETLPDIMCNIDVIFQICKLNL